MRRKRVYSDIDKDLCVEAEAQAKKLGISRAKLIEIALKSELGCFNVYKENKRLTEAKNKAEQETEALRQQLTTAEAEHKDTCDRLEREKSELTEQRDEFEKLLHELLHAEMDEVKDAQESLKQIASHLGGSPDTVEHYKQRIDELQESIQDKKRERNHFKAQAEEAQSKLKVCDTKLTLLLTRSWWERLWNTMPWVE